MKSCTKCKEQKNLEDFYIDGNNVKQISLVQGDCLKEMANIPDGSVDLILPHPPYGTTTCKWDTVIPLEPMWEHLKRIIKPKGAIVLFGGQPFTSVLLSSNLAMFKYCWVWESNRAPNFAQVTYMPLKFTEDIVVFSFAGMAFNAKSRMVYNPQGTKDIHKEMSGKKSNSHRASRVQQEGYIQKKTEYPRNIIKFNKDALPTHPTQKPVPLMEYLIKTYTNEKETVLDF